MRKNKIREQIGRSYQNRGKSTFQLLQTGVVLFGMLLLLNGCGIFMTHDLLFNEDSSAGESAASEESKIDKPESKAEASSSAPAPQKTPTPDRFQDSVDLEFYAEMGENIIGCPELTVSVINHSEYDVKAIQFYAIPYDVYGEKIDSFLTTEKLYTDTTIPARESNTCSFSMLDSSVKIVKLYAYSFLFSNGEEWRDRNAVKTTILKKGLFIEVSGEA